MTRHPFHELLRDLPPELQRAVHHCVAQCRPHIAPRPYTSDWHEELYHEAAYAACLAEATYDPDRGGSLYEWGVRVIGQHLKRFCDRVWASAKRECDPPCDEETGEEIECEDPTAQEPFAACILACALQQALQSLSPPDRQVAAWHWLEGLTERAIAQRLGRFAAGGTQTTGAHQSAPAPATGEIGAKFPANHPLEGTQVWQWRLLK